MNIVLASNSPRRSEILKNLKINFTKCASDVNEEQFQIDNPIELVQILAHEKAKSVLKQFSSNTIVIGADTIVTYENKILTKPKSRQDAYDYLRMLSGKKHSVFSGIAIINNVKSYISFAETYVYMRSYTDEEILSYIETKEPLDKAGAYAIQGYGSVLVDKIDGDYYNVVGLPISKLIEGLKTFNIDYFNSFH